MSLLSDLLDAVKRGSVEVIDLTAPLSDQTPILQLPEPFGNTWQFQLDEISRYDERGPAWYWNNIRTGEHTGTHLDAPIHWVTGQERDDVSQVPVQRLVAPAVVIDRADRAAADPDYLLSTGDIRAWEADHGPLPDGGWLLYRTGWDGRAGDEAAFLNGGRTPGIAIECAKWLAEEAPIIGVGVETVGTDAGAAHSFDPPFPCHSFLLGANKYGLTQLRNLDRLPPTGAVLIAAPLPIVRGSGSPSAVLADAYARTSGRLGVLSVHQGPGVTNALTGITEAAKSRTPMVVLAPDTGAAGARSNFRLDQASLAAGIGAVYERVATPDGAVDDVVRAVRRARAERRTVILGLPLDVQAAECAAPAPRPLPADPVVEPAPEAVAQLAAVLETAERPVFIAGRGARPDAARGDAARDAIAELAAASGALLATSAVAKGLFAGDPWYLDVSGGFASPLAAELITAADLVVAWGCTLNMWTTRHGRLLGPGATVVQVDTDPDALYANPRVDLGVLGDTAATARAVTGAAPRGAAPRERYRRPEVRERIAREVRWRDVPYDDESTAHGIDPRTLSIALDDALPAERVVAVDSGNFMGYPSMYLSVPDAAGFCFTQAFQSIELGLATAVGAALALPDRLPVAALGDGGFLMGVAELETVVRLGLPMLVVAYNDAAYGAEVHHFGPEGHPLETVSFPDTDLAAIGRGFGCDGATVRTKADLDAVHSWLDGPRERPLVVDAKVVAARGSWWLEEAFRGH